jgi:hypothetical protein
MQLRSGVLRFVSRHIRSPAVRGSNGSPHVGFTCIASTDLFIDEIEVFELPIAQRPPCGIDLSFWTVSMLWSQLSDNDDASRWLHFPISDPRLAHTHLQVTRAGLAHNCHNA